MGGRVLKVWFHSRQQVWPRLGAIPLLAHAGSLGFGWQTCGRSWWWVAGRGVEEDKEDGVYALRSPAPGPASSPGFVQGAGVSHQPSREILHTSGGFLGAGPLMHGEAVGTVPHAGVCVREDRAPGQVRLMEQVVMEVAWTLR